MSATGGTKPEFATNDEASGQRVADSINALMRGISQYTPPVVAIATAYFNPGGFNLLADELEQAASVRLLLGAEPLEGEGRVKVRALSEGRGRRGRAGVDPTVQRALEGHLRSLHDDRDLLGFNREDDARARRLVRWLRDHPGVEVRRYAKGFLHGKVFTVETNQHGLMAGSSNFTYAGLAKNNEVNVGLYQPSGIAQVTDWFEQQWQESEPYDLAALYEARWAQHQPSDVFLRMLHENYGDPPQESRSAGPLRLTGYQADGVWRAQRLLDRRHGVLIADEVGLGKTYTAGALIHTAAIERRQRVLIVCPATLRDSTWEPFLAEHNLPATVLSIDEFNNRVHDGSLVYDKFALIVVDEAHAFRNDSTSRAEALTKVLSSGPPKDVVLLTATPVNNSLRDLFVLLMYFARNDAAFADVGIPSLHRYFKHAMAMNPDDLSPEHLFDVLDATAVRRTRKFVKQHYQGDKVVVRGREQEIAFPTCRVRRTEYNLDSVLPDIFENVAVALGAELNDDELGESGGFTKAAPGSVLTMARYVPSAFRKTGQGIEQYEANAAGLLRSGMLKRFESSSIAFCHTVSRMIESHVHFLDALDAGLVLTGDALREWGASDSDDLDDFLTARANAKVIIGVNALPATSFDVPALQRLVRLDLAVLWRLWDKTRSVNQVNVALQHSDRLPRHPILPYTGDELTDAVALASQHPDYDFDPKIEALVGELVEIARDADDESPNDSDVASNKRKVIIFTYYTDTATYIEQALRELTNPESPIYDERLEPYRARFALVAGPNKGQRDAIISEFAPLTAGKGNEENRYDLLVATDVLAEGVNLQQARHIINYDLPWNPMRLVQRHGRVDRIGSPHSEVFMRCFFPEAGLEKFLGLEEKLQRKIKQAAASIGVGEILPDTVPVERVITENRALIEQLRREDAELFDTGTASAISGEEYRSRLAHAFEQNRSLRNRIVNQLPWGAGTGFVKSGAEPAIVFCARIGDHDKPVFRLVRLNQDLSVDYVAARDGSEELVPNLSRETLTALHRADPRSDTTPAYLTEAMYHAAFDAWAVAKSDIHQIWQQQTDPSNMSPKLPRVMLDAATCIERHGTHLGDLQDVYAQKFRSPHTTRVQRAAREALAGGVEGREQVDLLVAAADKYALTQPEPITPLPAIDETDINLICWSAVVPPPNERNEVWGALDPREVAANAIGELFASGDGLF